MKFDCGLTEKTIRDNFWNEREQRIKDAIADQKVWRRHFCWWPIQIGDNDCRWLEWVERRPEYSFKFWWDPPFEKYDVKKIYKWHYRALTT